MLFTGCSCCEAGRNESGWKLVISWRTNLSHSVFPWILEGKCSLRSHRGTPRRSSTLDSPCCSPDPISCSDKLQARRNWYTVLTFWSSNVLSITIRNTFFCFFFWKVGLTQRGICFGVVGDLEESNYTRNILKLYRGFIIYNVFKRLQMTSLYSSKPTFGRSNAFGGFVCLYVDDVQRAQLGLNDTCSKYEKCFSSRWKRTSGELKSNSKEGQSRADAGRSRTLICWCTSFATLAWKQKKWRRFSPTLWKDKTDSAYCARWAFCGFNL